MMSKKNLLLLMLCIGLIQIAGYYLAGSLARPDGGLALPQPDTLLYYQSARRIAEGHPFSMFPGEAMSTGNTTVLYPFILAVPYALGATGDALYTAGFLLNAFFYLVFLFGWGTVIGAWLKDPFARLSAALLIAFANQPAYCAMAQSDIGCWMAVSGLLAAGLATGKRTLAAPLLLLGPWIRPEGMVCVLAFTVILAAAVLLEKFRAPFRLKGLSFRKDALIALGGIVSLCGVFLLNTVLTGKPGFSSVANKGYFSTLPFGLGLQRTVIDGLLMAKELLLGIPRSFPREFYVFPVLGAVFMWIGLLFHDWRNEKASGKFIWLLAAAGGFATVAMSGWQNSNFDRYLAWLLPTLFLFMAEGVSFLAIRLPSAVRFLPASLLIGFESLLAVVTFFIFEGTCRETDFKRQFAVEAHRTLSPKVKIGGWGSCGVAYEMPGRPMIHLSGIYSPGMATRYAAEKLAILKHEPDKRFDCWFLESPLKSTPFGSDGPSLFGEEVCVGLDGLCIRKADWRTVDAALQTVAPTGLTLRASVDIGYVRDEKKVDYRIQSRFPGYRIDPFVREGPLNGQEKIVEVGRVILGWDEMTVPLQPGKPATVVMRTLSETEAGRISGVSAGPVRFAFANPLSFRIHVDGVDAGIATCAYKTNGFTDVRFTIPGSVLRQTPARVAFLGDHMACRYQFYQ